MTLDMEILNQSLYSVRSFLVKPWLGNFVMIIGIIVAFVTILVTWKLTQKQINEIRKIENDKRFIGVESLIFELEQNRNWVLQFIHDCVKGGHKGKIDNDVLLYSWVWNPPQLIAYENYLSIACGGDKELATKIINLYSRLKSCQVIVHFIHQLFINNVEDKITKYNDSLEKICLVIKNSFNEPIEKLKSIAENFNPSNERQHGSAVSLDISDYGTATHSPTYKASVTEGTISLPKIITGDEEKTIKREPTSDKNGDK